MASRFETKIIKSRARFVYRRYSPEQMIEVGEGFIGSMFSRWDRGENIRDLAAKPLSTKGRRGGYAGYKQRRGGKNIRDWKATGQLRAAVYIPTARANQVEIGIANVQHFATYEKRMRVVAQNLSSVQSVVTFNQRRESMWGASPRNITDVVKAFAALDSPVKAKQVA